ncbi:hypothetical protein [Bacillus chungangensis]|uniref:Uncharacterized protein n=1 Tax=Bacillus chungangensis TaxID=587633 RepID=A0ABT9WV71_9BACI|nr:hypothetical protein [Bacillus chungangensis]MDQ0176792.1 hypothetical protein [Bacillus chungangensis]
MKKKIGSFILSIAMFVLVVPQAFAFGDSNSDMENWVNENENEIRENFSALGIDENVQNNLIKKLQDGKQIDSMKQANLDKALQQLDTISVGESKTLTFDDGSKILFGSEKVEDKESAIVPFISAGSYQVKSYWYMGLLNASYLTDFVIVSGANNDYIVSSHSESVSIIGGSYSNVNLSTPRKYETSSRLAYSRLYFDYSVPTGSARFNLYFHVGDNDYNTALSLNDIK